MVILNVDDDSDDREMFCDAIKAVGPQLSCLLFESGQEVLDFLKGSKALPDYIFIDINMPLMDGHECARKIRSNPDFDQVKIVMYSTAFNPKDIAEFTQRGFKYLAKQNKFGDLVQSLQKVFA